MYESQLSGQRLPNNRASLLHEVVNHGLQYRHTDLDPSMNAIGHLGIQLPAQRIEEDSVMVMQQLQRTLKKLKVLPMSIVPIKPQNTPVPSVTVCEMLDSIQFHRRDVILKVLQQAIVYEDHADIAYSVLKDFEVEHADRFLLHSLHAKLQELPR